MKYKVQVYCSVPSSVEMSEQMKREIERQKLVINGYVEITFNSREALFYYVRSEDYVKPEVVGIKKPKRGDLKRFADTPDAIGNHILEATMTHENDSQRRKISLYKKPHDFYCIGYLVGDEYGRTIDLRNYVTELCKFDNDFYILKLHLSQLARVFSDRGSEQWYAELAKEMSEMESLFGKGWKGYDRYRDLRTFQAMRLASDREYRQFIRGKCRKLPNPYDEFHIRYSKSWKDRRKGKDKCSNLKLKRQRQVNLSRHVDTVMVDKKVYADALNEADYLECFDE